MSYTRLFLVEFPMKAQRMILSNSLAPKMGLLALRCQDIKTVKSVEDMHTLDLMINKLIKMLCKKIKSI